MAPLPSGGRRGLLVLALAASANAIKEPEYNLTTGLQLEHYRQCHGGLAAMTRSLGVQVADVDEDSVAASFGYLNHTRVNWTNFCHELAPSVGGFFEVMQEGVRRHRQLLGLEVSEEPMPTLFPYARAKVESIKNGMLIQARRASARGPLDARHLTANTSGNSTVPSFNISGALPPGRLNASNIDGDAADGLGPTLSNAAEGAVAALSPGSVRTKPPLAPIQGIEVYTRGVDDAAYPEGPFDVTVGFPPRGGAWQFYFGTLIPGCASPMDSTCDSNAEAAITIVLIALEVVQAITDALEGGDISGAILTVIKSAASIATNILTKIGDGQTNIDNSIASGWKLAAWANTNYIFEEVRCRESVLLHQNVPVQFAGCDGKDSDCDWFVDDVDEDNYAPRIEFEAGRKALEGKWFDNFNEPVDVLDLLVSGQDDCTPATLNRDTPKEAGPICLYNVTFTVADLAGNEGTPVTLPFHVDEVPPSITLSAMETLRASATDTTRAYVDIDLQIDVSDDCGQPTEVELFVHSDEVSADGTAQAVSYLVEGTPGWGLMLRNQAFEGTCNSNEQLCVGGIADGRVYEIQVCATDKAGNRACEETTVKVPIFQNTIISLLQGQALAGFNFPTAPVAIAGQDRYLVFSGKTTFPGLLAV